MRLRFNVGDFLKLSIKTFAIGCPELPDRREIADKHFKSRGLSVDWVFGIHGEKFGLLPSRPYNADQPGAGHLTPISQVGLTLSHYMTWQICLHCGGDEFIIVEDDAKLPEDWLPRLEIAMDDVPRDWDIILLGNSNTADKPSTHICGDIFEVLYPFTTHCYAVHRKALPTLLTCCRDATTKIDLLLIREAYPKLRVYCMLPRLIDQRGTELAV